MKRTAIDILFGILIFIVIILCEMLVTLPFGAPKDIDTAYKHNVNIELLLTSLPAALVTFLSTLLLKTKSKRDALKKSILWTLIIALCYLAIGIGNGVLGDLFTTIGMYTLLACAFIGPLVYAWTKHLK